MNACTVRVCVYKCQILISSNPHRPCCVCEPLIAFTAEQLQWSFNDWGETWNIRIYLEDTVRMKNHHSKYNNGRFSRWGPNDTEKSCSPLKTRLDKRLYMTKNLDLKCGKDAVISIREKCLVMYNPSLDQRTAQLFAPSLISFDTRRATHPPLLLCFCCSFTEHFICCGIWIDALTTVELAVPSPSPPPPARLHQHQSFYKTGNPLPFLFPYSLLLSPQWTSTNHLRKG